MLEADRLPSADAYDAAGLAGTIAETPGDRRVAALWLAAPGTDPTGGRLAVAVTEAAATGDLTALAEAMEGTVAQLIVDPDNPKTALSVRAMLTANLSALEFLPGEGRPFSIREWIADKDRDRFLFLTSRGDGSGARLRAASLPP